jgi:C1A family cysteine protease
MNKIRIACLFIIFGLLLVPSFHVLRGRIGNEETELKKVQSVIKEKGLRWNAGLTDVAMRSHEEKEKMLGGAIAELGPDVKQIFVQGDYGLPSYFDWRNEYGVDWMTSVKYQGGCGSCWAFAAVGAIEAKFNIYNNNSDLDLDLSEQQLVSNGGVCCEDCGDCNGGYPGKAVAYAKYTGIVDEECFPYTASNSECNLCTDWQERLHRIEDYFWVRPNTADAYKKALTDYGPLVVVLNASEDLFYYVGGVYEPTGLYEGADHAVVLVGYNDTEGCWIVKNSWSTDWGENGYGKVSYGNLEKYDYVLAINATDSYTHADIAIVNVTASKTIVGQGFSLHTNITVENQNYLTATFNVTAYANETTIDTLTNITLTNRNSTVITFTWNTTGMPKGNYTITVYATAVQNETDTDDNVLADGWVVITIPGDLDLDSRVFLYDLTIVGTAWNSRPGDPHWCANADIDGDRHVFLYDLITVGSYYD